MKEVREKLPGTIKAEIKVQHRIIRLLKEQQEILVRCTYNALEENLKDLEELRYEARELNRDRENQKEALARWLELEKKEISLGELARFVGESQGESLLKLRERLVNAAKTVRIQTRRNMLLIRQSLEVNHALIAGAKGNAADHLATYGKRGERVPSDGSGIVDARV